MKKLLMGLAVLTASAWADPLNGSVYDVYPEGVMLNQGATSMLIPVQHATFQVAGLRVDYSQLLPGQAVQVVVPQPYLPQIVAVPDAYAWKCKYHPNHPHGGPPGQMKKMNGNGKGKWK